MGNTAKSVSEPASPDVIAAEIDRLANLPVTELRSAWLKEFRRAPPKGLWRDLLLRSLAWRLQEKAFGGHGKATQRLLDGYGRKANGDWQIYQRLKAGTVLVREFKGIRHTVTSAPEGFIWQEKSYSSLSAIAKVITGANWNGPRFFGLREGRFEADSDGQTRAA